MRGGVRQAFVHGLFLQVYPCASLPNGLCQRANLESVFLTLLCKCRIPKVIFLIAHSQSTFSKYPMVFYPSFYPICFGKDRRDTTIVG